MEIKKEKEEIAVIALISRDIYSIAFTSRGHAWILQKLYTFKTFSAHYLFKYKWETCVQNTYDLILKVEQM